MLRLTLMGMLQVHVEKGGDCLACPAQPRPPMIMGRNPPPPPLLNDCNLIMLPPGDTEEDCKGSCSRLVPCRCRSSPKIYLSTTRPPLMSLFELAWSLPMKTLFFAKSYQILENLAAVICSNYMIKDHNLSHKHSTTGETDRVDKMCPKFVGF
jgi:hypothetical protein